MIADIKGGSLFRFKFSPIKSKAKAERITKPAYSELVKSLKDYVKKNLSKQ